MNFRKAALLFMAVVMVFLLHQCVVWGASSADYETREIAQYGTYVGNDEKFMKAYIERFFPAEISPEFQDVTYVFKSRAVDTIGFETYLEFTMEHDDQFQAFVSSFTEGFLSRPFHFDPAYQEYVLCDEDDGFVNDFLMLGRLCCREDHPGFSTGKECTMGPHPGQFYSIDSARIGKILVNHDDNRIIFVALAVSDGGASDVDFFCEYFNRFNIDPKEYEAYTKEFSGNG